MLTKNKLEMTLDIFGDIVMASCGCPAGGKPYGSCKHIATLCYALEAYCRLIEETRQEDSCTSHLQEWNRPRKRRLPPQEVEGIAFVKEEYGKSKRPVQPMIYDPQPAELQHTTAAEIEALRDALLATGKDVAFLHVLPLPNSTLSNAGKGLNHHNIVISLHYSNYRILHYAYTYASFTTITFAVPREGIGSAEVTVTATKHRTNFQGL